MSHTRVCDGVYSGGLRPPPLVLHLYLLDRVMQMYYLNGWVIQIVFVEWGHTDVFV
jgi:hypothetical protein